MKIGDIVKSYDFVGNTECYFVGEVVDIEGDLFKAKTVKIVFGGKVKPIVEGRNDSFVAPLQGKNFFDESFPDFQRVQVIG